MVFFKHTKISVITPGDCASALRPITVCHLARGDNGGGGLQPPFAPGLSVCPLSGHLPHRVVFEWKEAVTRERRFECEITEQ